MDQLARDLVGSANQFYDPEISDTAATSSPETIAVQEAAERWAIAALRTFTGQTLAKALAISKAMSEFVADVENRQ